MYCSYYQANVKREKTWFFVGVMRSFENIVFDRTLDKEKCLLEFFVPSDREDVFLGMMDYMIENGVVSNLEKKENRLELAK